MVQMRRVSMQELNRVCGSVRCTAAAIAVTLNQADKRAVVTTIQHQ